MPYKTANFTQRVTVNAPPQVIYDILMNAKKHAALTGASTRISARVGGAFEAYDGYAHGRTTDLVPGRRIVQTWRAHEPDWPEDHFSEVVFDLKANGRGRTTITFAHKKVPAALVRNFKAGWREFYWTPLKAMFP